MRIAFLGTPEFAAVTLGALLESHHEVAVAVSQPDKPSGRGRRLKPTPVRAAAEAASVPVLQPKSVKTGEFREEFQSFGVDAAVVVAYGKILPPELLSVPRHGFLNVHASLLPAYRGAAPIQWAIANGERKTGVTIMQIDEGLDSGPIHSMEEVDILEDDDARSVADMLSIVGARLMVAALDDIEAKGGVVTTPQDHEAATLAPLISKEDARVDWTNSPERIVCLARGFVVWPGAWTQLRGETLKILAAEACDPAWLDVDPKDDAVLPGTVLEVLKGRGLAVKCGDGDVLLLTQVQLPGKKPITALDAANGGALKPGDRLG